MYCSYKGERTREGERERERERERRKEREKEAKKELVGGRGREDKSQKGCMISAENVKKIFDKNNSEPQPNNSSSKLVRIEIIY